MPTPGGRHYPIMIALLGVTVALALSSLPAHRIDVFAILKSEKDKTLAMDLASHSEVESLREKVAALSWELLKTRESMDSLTEFREKFPWERIPCCIPASILAKRDSSPHRSSFVIDRGSSDGVVAGSVVVFGDCLMGRVWEVGPNTSRVLSVTDPKMRIAVVLLSELPDSQIRCGEGVCIGTGSGCQLQLVEKDCPKWSIAYAVTSGFEGDYPSGLVIGRVEYIAPDKEAAEEETSIGMFWNLQVHPKNLDQIHGVLILNAQNSEKIPGDPGRDARSERH